jgi:hypothetical protein
MDLYSLDEHGGLLNLIRSDDAGATWHTIAEPPTRHTYANSLNQSSKGFTWGDAVPSWTVALPDGSLLGRVRWNGSPGVPPYLITSAGPDWSRAFAVHAHLPARRGPVNVYTFEHLATVSTSGGSSVVFVYEDSIMGSLSPGLLRSTDGGQTWTQVADR